MFRTEDFIEEIKSRPAIYNSKIKDYLNRELKTILWHEIAEAMYENFNDIEEFDRKEIIKSLVLRWKNVRDQFMKDVKRTQNERKGGKKRKRYCYYENMEFLLRCDEENTQCIAVKTVKKRKINYVPERDNSKSTTNTIPPPNNSIGIVSAPVISQGIEATTSHQDSDPMGNRAFLMSLLPLVNQIPQHLIIETRLKIMNTLQNYVPSNPKIEMVNCDDF